MWLHARADFVQKNLSAMEAAPDDESAPLASVRVVSVRQTQAPAVVGTSARVSSSAPRLSHERRFSHERGVSSPKKIALAMVVILLIVPVLTALAIIASGQFMEGVHHHYLVTGPVMPPPSPRPPPPPISHKGGQHEHDHLHASLRGITGAGADHVHAKPAGP